jgi:COMPASS component SWD3
MNKIDPIFVLRGHKDGVSCLDFNQNGNSLLSGSAEGLVCLWDFRTRRITESIEAHKRGVVILKWLDENRFASQGDFH